MECFSLLPGELWEQIFLYSSINDIVSLVDLLPGYSVTQIKSKELWIRRLIIEGVPSFYIHVYKNIHLIEWPININNKYFYMQSYEIIRQIYDNYKMYYRSMKLTFNIIVTVYQYIDIDFNIKRLTDNYIEDVDILMNILDVNMNRIRLFFYFNNDTEPYIFKNGLGRLLTEDEYIVYIVKYSKYSLKYESW